MTKKTILLILIHVLCSAAFLALPYIFGPSKLPRFTELATNPHEWSNFISYCLMLAFFFLTYYWVIPWLFFRRRYLAFVFSQVVCFGIVVLAIIALDRPEVRTMSFSSRPELSMPPRDRPDTAERGFGSTPRPKPPFRAELGHLLFLFLVGTFVTLSLRINNQWKQAEQEKLNAELLYLKAQINPHFLFNSLNSIYALAMEKSDQAPDAVIMLRR